MARQRVIQLKKIEEEKFLNETKRQHEEQVDYKNLINY
jgi:hypothetical protein